MTAANGPAKLGVLIDNFIRIYGQPQGNVSSPKDGVYYFTNGNNYLGANTSSGENNRVDDITLIHADNSDLGSLQSTIPECEKFIPSDATYQRVVELYNPANGKHTTTERVYFSSQLASLFKASDYTDEHGNQATPGTFAIAFEYDLIAQDPSQVDSCSIQVVLEQIQKS